MGHDAASLQAAVPGFGTGRARRHCIIAFPDVVSNAVEKLGISGSPFWGQKTDPNLYPGVRNETRNWYPNLGTRNPCFFTQKVNYNLAESDTKTSKLILSVSGSIPTESTQMHVPNDPSKRQL